MQVTIEPVEAQSADDLEQAFSTIDQKQLNGLVVAPDPIFFNERARIAEWSASRGLPMMTFLREATEAGALISYGVSAPEEWRRADGYIDKILKGAKPADLPVEQPTKLDLVINLKTAKTLGLTIPQTLLVAADEVIE